MRAKNEQRFRTVRRSELKKLRRGLKLVVPVLVFGLVLAGCGFLTILDNVTAVAQTSGLSYPIVDTGQALTYDNANALSTEPSVGSAFYGQDAQMDGNQPSYRDNGDGTVTDLVTGLMWQQGYSGKMSQSEAEAGADSFHLAGYTDWRLPTIKELYSLIDFSGEDIDPMATSANTPFIDTANFTFAYGDTAAGERIIDSQWATTTLYTGSTKFAGGAQLMFGVNFADGRIKGYPIGATLSPGGGEKTYFVRYVRGNASYGENSFVNNGDGTISDFSTGLMWSQNDSGAAMNWEDALAFVQDLNGQHYLGYSDWYLPNAKELQSIVDYDRSPDATNSAAIDPIFNVTSITNEDGQTDWGYYWTSTTHASARGGQSAVYIAFGRGMGFMNGQFMDVHGAGCQRSDPKTGSPSYGNAPQGDVVRVQNFVRVVRSISSTSTASLGSSEPPNSNVLGAVDKAKDAGAIRTSKQDENFILFAPLGSTTAYLIDRDGDVVTDWTLSGKPGNAVYLLEGGELLATYTVGGALHGGGIGGGVELLTWEGKKIWSYELATETAHLHHDVEMLPNGNVLMISWEVKSRAQALAAGLFANQLPPSGEVWSEMILEYSPSLDRIVWEWHLWDHALPLGEDPSANPGKIDLGFASNRQSSDWWHLNAIDYNKELDQIVISSRNVSEIWIIDHNLTTAQAAGADGDLLYRYGNPEAYGASGVQGLLHQHNPTWLDNGNLLVFDNGDPRLRPYSRVVELELPDYGNSPSGVVLPTQVVWSYGEAVGDEFFFADHISGAQRLDSGNTLICSGTEGRFFEVTTEAETVWEYINPFTSTLPNGKTSNEVFRCQLYSAEFIGQALSASLPTSSASPISKTADETGVPESARSHRLFSSPERAIKR